MIEKLFLIEYIIKNNNNEDEKLHVIISTFDL